MRMATILFCLTFFLLLSVLLNSAEAFSVGDNGEVEVVERSDFPDGFLFGVATSSYQIEGAFLEDGKGPSNWDAFVRAKGNVENGDIADDHYHRYLEDIEIIHSLGVDSYRFSISWSRILPRGQVGDVNPDGIMFYNKLIDGLLLRGIQPFVTIHHNDYPQELEDRHGGWLSPLMQNDFAYFAETCFKSFGDRVKYWVTINEPNLVADLAFKKGIYPPTHCSPPFGNCSVGNSDTEPLIAMHNMLLGHAKAVKLYREQFQSEQGGIIGIVISAFMYEPLSYDELDRDAASRALAFHVAWTSDPLVFGDYPPEMRHYHGSELPTFTLVERELIKDSIDFLGINHYATLYAKDCIHAHGVSLDSNCTPCGEHAITGFLDITPWRDGVLIGEPTAVPKCYVVPRGMEEIVEYVKERYHNKPMFITENGYSSPLQQAHLDDFQNDVKRVEFHKAYLASLVRAMRNGADVRGYFIWTLMDDFEWALGYAARFGLYSVDPVSMNRSPRLSAKWYRYFLRNISLVNDKHPNTATSFGNKDGVMLNVQEGRAPM